MKITQGTTTEEWDGLQPCGHAFLVHVTYGLAWGVRGTTVPPLLNVFTVCWDAQLRHGDHSQGEGVNVCAM
jgi:hypothetical protein